LLGGIDAVTVPARSPHGAHVFHQYTIRVRPDAKGGRDGLAAHLKSRGIPHAVYYPVPLHQLPVFAGEAHSAGHGDLTETERAAREVISLPMHTELTEEQLERVSNAVIEYFA
ncbi:MAG TPA: DegT/DnrJ/EryC1/StrS family aminotransferase, partial [Rhodothermales bacterium]